MAAQPSPSSFGRMVAAVIEQQLTSAGLGLAEQQLFPPMRSSRLTRGVTQTPSSLDIPLTSALPSTFVARRILAVLYAVQRVVLVIGIGKSRSVPMTTVEESPGTDSPTGVAFLKQIYAIVAARSNAVAMKVGLRCQGRRHR
ncbi:hypothetical protein U1Q18_015933 [Sarracenia purpurea var. burkii]